MTNDTADEQARISQLYAGNKSAFHAAQESAAKGDWQSFEKTPIANDTPADAMELKPCPFCQREAIWRPMTEECGVPFGVNVQHTSDCWLNYEKTGRAPFDDLPVRWNTRTTSLAAQDSWQPLSQDDAETELLSCLKNMKVAGDDKCLIDEMRWRGLWIYRKTGTRPSLAAQDVLVDALRHIVHLFDSRPITEQLFKPSAVTDIRAALASIEQPHD